MTFLVRPVREEDAESIVELLDPLIEAGTYTAMDEPVTLEGQVAFIRGFPEGGVFHVAERGGTIVGIQDVVLDGEISTFVRLGSHREGVGRALTEATLREARKRGFARIRATIRSDNAGAIAFYRNQGFRTVGTTRDRVLLERLLD